MQGFRLQTGTFGANAKIELMRAEAVVAAIAHEVRQPLAAIRRTPAPGSDF